MDFLFNPILLRIHHKVRIKISVYELFFNLLSQYKFATNCILSNTYEEAAISEIVCHKWFHGLKNFPLGTAWQWKTQGFCKCKIEGINQERLLKSRGNGTFIGSDSTKNFKMLLRTWKWSKKMEIEVWWVETEVLWTGFWFSCFVLIIQRTEKQGIFGSSFHVEG